MNETSFRPGDIIIFQAEDSWLSKCIAWLTDSDVSHAAMFYTMDSIAECGAPGVEVHPVTVSSGEAAYVMRLDPEMDPKPLLEAADRYIKHHQPYDFPALLLLAGLLIYQKIPLSGRLCAVANCILSAACLMLDKLLNEYLLKHSDRAMVCSQFVYQVFSDCGGSYQIRLAPHSHSNSRPISIPADTAPNADPDQGMIRIIDLLEGYKAVTASPKETTENTELSSEEMGRMLYEALQSAENENNVVLFDSNLGGVLDAAQMFLGKMQELLDLTKSGMPLDALFVTPADLAYHASNLKNVGTVTIKRIHSDT